MPVNTSYSIVATYGTFSKFLTLNIKSPHVHSYTETLIEPTCTENGIRTFVCECGDSYTQNINALGHDEISANNAVSPNCVTNGKYSDTKCSMCGITLTVGKIIPAVGHLYEDLVTSPTCVKQGYTTHICSVCGDSYIDNIVEILNHNYVSSITKEPTCTEKGVRTYTCTRCNNSYTEQIAEKGHISISANNAVAATCTTVGKNSDTKCSVCGTTLTTGSTIAAKGHSYGTVSYLKQKTRGKKIVSCFLLKEFNLYIFNNVI